MDTGTNADWDADSGVWDVDASYWDTVARRKTVVIRPTASKILLLDDGTDNAGSPVTATMQRTGLAIVGQKRDGTPINDFAQVKMVKRTWIRASGNAFTVRLGMQNTIEGSLVWSSSETFDPATDLYVDIIVTGPVLAIEFSGTETFTVQGYKMEVSPAGRVMPL
jgi:hypothetical protein